MKKVLFLLSVFMLSAAAYAQSGYVKNCYIFI